MKGACRTQKNFVADDTDHHICPQVQRQSDLNFWIFVLEIFHWHGRRSLTRSDRRSLLYQFLRQVRLHGTGCWGWTMFCGSENGVKVLEPIAPIRVLVELCSNISKLLQLEFLGGIVPCGHQFLKHQKLAPWQATSYWVIQPFLPLRLRDLQISFWRHGA